MDRLGATKLHVPCWWARGCPGSRGGLRLCWYSCIFCKLRPIGLELCETRNQAAVSYETTHSDPHALSETSDKGFKAYLRGEY